MAESMQGLHRTCRCAEVTKEMKGKEIVLMGWVQKARDKGGIIFVDLRDRSGIMQLIFENGSIDADGFAKAGKLRSEFVIAVTGVVEERGGAVNKNLATGEIELRVNSLRVLSEAEVPPFPIEENCKTKDEIRLKYRYLDLRRPDIQKNIIRIGNHALSATQNVKSGIIKRGNGMEQTDTDGPEQGIILYKNNETQCCADQFD